MKKILIILSALLFSSLLFSQIQFKENIIIEKLVQDALGIFACDIDMDNDLDLIVASAYDNKISWFNNLGGGNFGEQHIITNEALGAMSVIAADLDGDEDYDVISASPDDNKIAWYENDGFGNFGPQIIISTLAAFPKSIFAIDLDNDGDNDVLSASWDNKIAWYENDSLGNFGTQQIISYAVLYPFSVFSIDLDGDNDPDVLSASVLDNKIAWYENLGSSNFGPQQVITTQTLEARSVFASDLDGDGDNDVISASVMDKKIAWYENDGQGNFGPQQIISSSFKPASIYAIDLDSDGDIDIISNPSYFDDLVWFENDGSGNFGNPIYIDNITNSRGLTCADFNNDNEIDVCVTFDYCDIVWYPNDSIGNFGQRHIITFGINSPNSLLLSDLDGDGKNDIVCGSDLNDGITWFKNLGTGNYILFDTITFELFGIKDLASADFDGDGDNDVVSLSTGNSEKKIAWFENDSLGHFGPPQIISDSAIAPRAVFTADMDGDGDMDILFGSANGSVSTSGQKVSWWKNDGSGNFGNEIVISQSPQACSDVVAADLDNDGDMDILAAKGQVMWYENQGGAASFNVHFISAGIGFATQVAAADLDGDNDLDVICSADDASGNGDIRWWKNNGSGSFTSMPSLIAWLAEPMDISIADLDKDGDLDIIGQQALYSTSLFWFANDGLGNFGTLQLISDTLAVTSIISSDLDDDGDCDILYNSNFVGKILWAENLGYRTTISDSVCSNLTFAFGSQVLTSPGTYHDTLQTIFGLDSVVELAFSQIPIPSVSISPFPQDTFCIQTGTTDFPLASPIGGYFAGAGVSASNINLNLADTGIHDISYHFTDTATGCANSDTTQLIIIFCLSVAEEESLKISVYPNPASNFINISFKNVLPSGPVTCTLFNSTGKEILVDKPREFPFRIEISQLKAGIYYLRIEVGEKVVRYKIVKQ